jgi:hypothetical protein
MDGGASTGPRTAEGRPRSRRLRWKHGLYSAEVLAERKRVRELLTQSPELLKQMERGLIRWPRCIGFIPRSPATKTTNSL